MQSSPSTVPVQLSKGGPGSRAIPGVSGRRQAGNGGRSSTMCR